MDISKDKKWSKLRGRLHMLGYNHNLGQESVPLVEQLFSDLVHTTESLHESQRSTDKSEKESQNSDVRLVRENQELHLELMTVKGEKANVTRELKVYITKLDSDLALLKSLNKQYLQEMHSLEKDCKEKARLIRQLRQKNLTSWVQAVDANKTPTDDPEAADLQQAEFTRLKTSLENSQGHIQHLNNQIDELQETNATLEQKLKGVQHTSSGKVAELTSKNHELCQEMTDIRNLAKLMELEKKQKLQKAEMKLQDLQDIIRKQRGVIKDLEDQLSKKRMASDLPVEQESRTADQQNNICNGFAFQEASDQEFVKSQLGDQLRDLREQNEKFEAMVEFLAAEKSRLQDKVQKMMSVEKVVVLELEGWRTKYGICGRERSPSRLDAFVKSLEEERDHFRLEAEHYQNLWIFSSRSSDRQRSQATERLDYQSSNPPAEIRNLRQKLRLVEAQLQQVTKEKVSLMEELKAHDSSNTSPEILKPKKTFKQVLQETKEKGKKRKDGMEEDLQEPQPEQRDLTKSDEFLDLKEELSLVEEKNQLLTAEKDSLLEEFQKKELQCDQYTSEVSDLLEQLKGAEEKIQQLTSEKDALVEELKQKQLQQDANTSAEISTLKENLKKAEVIIQMLKSGNENKTERLKQMQKEKIGPASTAIDPLVEELKQMQEQHEKQLSDASGEISKLQAERQQGEEKLQQLTSEKDSLMEELKQKQLQYEEHDTKTSAEISTLKENLKKMAQSEKDKLREELMRAKLEHDKQLALNFAEMSKLNEELKQATKKKKTEQAQTQTADDGRSTSDEIANLKEQRESAEEQIQQMTDEKDSLMEELKQQQLQYEQHASDTFAEISDLREKLRVAEDKIQQQKRDVERNSKTSAEMFKLEEKIKMAEDKLQRVKHEKDAQMEELMQIQLKHAEQRSKTSAEIAKLEQKLRLAEEKLQQVEAEKEVVTEELEQLQQSADRSSASSSEVVKLTVKLRLAEEKIKRLTTEKDALTEELKEMQLQNERLASSTSAEISALKESLRLAEEKIQQVTEEKNSQLEELKQKTRANISDQISDMKDKLRLAEEKIQRLTEEKHKREAEQLQSADRNAKGAAEVLQLKEKLQRAETKIELVTEEKESLIEEMKQKTRSNTSEEIANLKETLKLAQEKLRNVRTEKETLMEELNQKKTSSPSEELSGLKAKLRLAEEKIQRLTAENDSLKEELKMRDDPSTSAEALNTLRDRLQLAERKIQRVTAEKDSLREELKGDTISPQPYGRGQENRILGLEQENLELRSQVFELRNRERDLERQMNARSAALVQNPEEVVWQRKAAAGLRQQQEQIHYALLDLQHMLSVKNNELDSTHSQMEKLKDIIGTDTALIPFVDPCLIFLGGGGGSISAKWVLPDSLSQQVYQHKQEAEVLRISFSALKIRKNVLEEEVATKTKRLAVLQEELGKKLDVEQKSQEREQATHRMLETHQEALLRLTRDNELIIGDYRRLQDDVAAMTQEKQAAHEKMEEALREREALKQRVHSYVDTVSRIENILQTKNQENLDLVERFRTARSDVQEREQRLQQVEEFIGSVRLELISSETERQHLREALGRKVQEIQQHMQDLHTYKTQVASLTHGMSQLEEEIRVLQEEKASLLADLASVREVCVKMDSDKEIAARQLLQANMELERATTRQEDALTEAALLKEHLRSEKLAVRNMQAMLAANRQEMFQAHREASEKEAELKALQQMLTLADNKIGVNAKEVTNLRGKVTQLQTKMEVLSSKVLECNTSEDISFRPLRASSPVDHPATHRQPAPDSSIQREEPKGQDSPSQVH
ncbi:centrosomal protein of 135 kDa-like isoform X2 [Hippocampus zosterae]|uniref:centrosomal protein of 135 kDa-like isoform X2 n=1 Tax=Hippocampus zosterae TaxID=109293 RepID=UPI00223DF465|nr:centrosomal protein of 135 kDa-like isoform X2 [Hippocampus zosterae]